MTFPDDLDSSSGKPVTAGACFVVLFLAAILWALLYSLWGAL